MAPDCQACGGRGWIIAPDEGGGSARRCACQSAPRPIAELLAASRMRPAEMAAAIEPWDETAAPFPHAAALWAQQKAADAEVGQWALVLLSAVEVSLSGPTTPGAPGRGKTKAAALAMRAWCERTNKPGLWVNVPADLSTVMEDRRLDQGGSGLEFKIRRAPFLVLDDVGFERDTEARTSAIAEWVYHRYRERLPTLFTSNAASPDHLGDGRIASRLVEAQVRYLVGVRDYREFRAEGEQQ